MLGVETRHAKLIDEPMPQLASTPHCEQGDGMLRDKPTLSNKGAGSVRHHIGQLYNGNHWSSINELRRCVSHVLYGNRQLLYPRELYVSGVQWIYGTPVLCGITTACTKSAMVRTPINAFGPKTDYTYNIICVCLIKAPNLLAWP